MNVTPSPPDSFDTEVGHGRLVTAVRRHIMECVSTFYPDLMPGSVSVEVIPQRHIFANSTHLKCLVRGQTDESQWVQRCIYAKRSRLVDIEYANLVYLWDNYFRGDSINRIPRPVDCWTQYNLLLTEFISDQTALLPWLIRYTSPLGMHLNRRSAIMRMQRIADWLVAFQSGTNSAGIEPLPVYIDGIDEALNDLIATPYFPPEARRYIIEWLSSARSTTTRTSPVLSHGDFAARNILLDQSSVTVVDWEKPLVKRHLLYDVQTFMVNLERRLSYPFCSRQRIEELREAFLTRYLAQIPFEVNEQLLAVTRVVVLIHQLEMQYRGLRNHRIKAILKRRGWFIRYLLAEIEREIGLG
jgi:hypothetical protein